MRILLICMFTLTSLSLLYGQPVIAPIEHNPLQAEQFKKNKAFKLTAVTDTIDIPFFEDFTTSSIVSDTSKWIENGGTFISNSYAINPPNFNVATFDGLKANGSPYNLTSGGSIISLADNLTSRPIDLSVLQDGDVLHLRFYWQGETLGEIPDPNEDSIRLQIKNRSGVWRTIWKHSGDSSGFNLQQNVISDSAQYFYKGFQFRFQNFGRLSGSFDVWNIDYIMLDTGMLAADNWTPDISFVAPPSSILKNYTAMPLAQFRQTDLADTISVLIKSLNNKERGGNIKDTLFINDQNKIQDDSIFFIDPGEIIPRVIKVDSTQFKNFTGESILKYKFALEPTGGDPKIGVTYHYFVDGDNAGTSRIDFQVNDTVSTITPLSDYFAYDDGSAEFGYGVNQFHGKVAVRFELNEPDTLTHVNIYFPKIIQDRTGEAIVLMIWSDLQVGTSDHTLLYNETVTVNHPTDIDVFKSYELSTPLYITSPIFYVGYQQLLDEYIFTGFDRNNDKSENIFYFIEGTWREYQLDPGTLMIRPVFKNQLITGIKKPTNELEATVFPNPSNGETFISGEAAEAYIYDLSGKLLLSQTFDSRNHHLKSLDISSLPDGFYLLHLVNGEKKTVRKIILRR